jgi:hypothetical protein
MMMRRQTENPQANQLGNSKDSSKPQLPNPVIKQSAQTENVDDNKKQVRIVEQEPKPQQNDPMRLSRAKTAFDEPKGDVNSIKDNWRKQKTVLGSKPSEGLFDENSSEEDQEEEGGLFQNNPKVQVSLEKYG